VLGNTDLVELCLAPLGGVELRLACVSKAWRAAAQRLPHRLVIVDVDGERKLRFACGRVGATVQLQPTTYALTGGRLEIAAGVTLQWQG